jgi:hypothetical protein
VQVLGPVSHHGLLAPRRRPPRQKQSRHTGERSIILGVAARRLRAMLAGPRSHLTGLVARRTELFGRSRRPLPISFNGLPVRSSRPKLTDLLAPARGRPLLPARAACIDCARMEAEPGRMATRGYGEAISRYLNRVGQVILQSRCQP